MWGAEGGGEKGQEGGGCVYEGQWEGSLRY